MSIGIIELLFILVPLLIIVAIVAGVVWWAKKVRSDQQDIKQMLTEQQMAQGSTPQPGTGSAQI
ncbi:hypothetical protein ACL1HS_05390 [Corynebacterium striatum]|uniref:hypothetical protein n=1 Tax=Corynebacterium striatum TaxID=43770 RepID=UPI00141A1771|nr:hypothetical protein [Corynebacterium striatum]MCG7249214.1 hypothetical protein [Corynebacterium striatum]NHY10864.1 hypothetical protein [Corynebacterium striatum]NHY35283.1 hypothetical protein [Corynebacterium striatum]HAT1131797.1 hypothetical protein [Corynebacterium striatum]HAT1139098.1 hypothetical protein [Corynebacterium striatum]